RAAGCQDIMITRRDAPSQRAIGGARPLRNVTGPVSANRADFPWGSATTGIPSCDDDARGPGKAAVTGGSPDTRRSEPGSDPGRSDGDTRRVDREGPERDRPKGSN